METKEQRWIQIRVEKEFAEIYLQDGVELFQFDNGDTFIRGELVATYEGIIQ